MLGSVSALSSEIGRQEPVHRFVNGGKHGLANTNITRMSLHRIREKQT